ncbi:MAG TPA: protein kinase, partial [Candidatus Binatia bacterium]|nr:protein kinase [Candidatus Binatia bacterium]
MALLPDSRLGPYEIVGPLGGGGMGEVYRARDTRLGRDVAIKALPPAFAADPARLSRFRREAQTLASLNHPNIASIYGLEESGGAPHLVLELVEGETLAARLKRGALPQTEALALGIQIAGAIEAAHERGIVHRDLKPGNVMINPAGTAKVVDFGLAKSDSGPGSGSDALTAAEHPDATAEGVILGTVAYMSPEQARGKPVDRRSDVWSFGCVLYECYAGRPAFAGETASDLIARILEREPDWTALPAGTPPRIREILRRCLRKSADERPRDIRDVRLELCDVASGGGKSTAAREKSIAVLPFENLSGADDEFFADGVTDEILNVLAQVDGLRVAARASCFAFKGRREDLRAIGEKLDVTTVLEGTVRRAGSRLRITAQLANAADGYQLWSERYDREMTDVFAVQDEIASAIATRLRGTMHAEADRSRARGGTKNLEAFELVLRGRALQIKRGRFMPQAVACFERAIAIDPQYAEPLASLSDSYRLMGTFGVAPFAEVMSKSKALAERALAIDPGLDEAWSTLAAVEEQYEWNFAHSDSLYDRALELEPRNATARAQWALWRVLRGVMSDEVALSQLHRAVQDDPLNSWVGGMNSYLLGIAGRDEDSIVEAERSLAIDAESFFARWNVMRAHAWAGDYPRAIEEAPALLGDSGRHHWALGLLAWTYGRAGRADRARACYDELEGRSRHEFVSPSWISVTAGSAKLEELAMRWT